MCIEMVKKAKIVDSGKGDSDQTQEIENEEQKRADLYKKTIKRTLKAGTKNLDNDPVLQELRKTLNISDELHIKLKEEIQAEMAKLEKIQAEFKLQIAKMERQVIDIKKKRLDVEYLEDLVVRSKKARREQAFLELNEIVNEFYDHADNLNRKYKVQHQIKNVNHIVKKIEVLGANVKDIRKMIEKSEAALNKNQFSEAAKIATKAKKESIKLKKFGSAKAIIEKFIPMLDKAKKICNVSESTKLLKGAQRALKRNDYETVRSSIKKAKQALKNSKREAIAKDNVKKVHEIIDKARDIGVDLVSILPLVNQIERDFEEKNYSKLTTNAAKIRKVVEENRKYKTAEDKIKLAQLAINEARKSGSSVKTATRYLSQAKVAFKKKKYQQVHKYTRSAIKIAKDAMTTAIRRKASSAISSAKFLIKDVKDFGVDVTDAEKLLESAEDAFKKNDFASVESLSMEAEQLAKKTFEMKKKEYLKKSIEETLINIKFMIEELQEVKGDTIEIEKLYNVGKEQLEADDLKKAEKTVKDAETLAKEMLDKAKEEYQVDQAISGLERSKKIIMDAKELEIDTSEVEALLSQAEELFNNEQYSEVIEKNNEINKKISELKDNILRSRTQELIESTTLLLNNFKNDGADVSEAEKIMEDANKQFEAGNFSRADELVRHCELIAQEEWNNFRKNQSYNSISNVEKLLAGAQEYGIDITEAQHLLENASDKLKDKEYDEAEELIKRAEQLASIDWQTQRKVEAEGSLNNLKKMYNELTISGSTMEEFKELISKIEEKINTGEYESIGDVINRANIISSELLLEEKVKTYSERINRNKKLINKLKESGIDTEKVDKLIEETEELYQNKEYQNIDKNLEQIEIETQNLLLKRWNDISPVLISSTKERIEKSREIGGDVKRAEEYLAKAEMMLANEDVDVLEAEDILTKAEFEAKHSWVERKTELAEEAMSSAQSKIQETKELGADVTDAEQLLTEVESLFEDEDFDMIEQKLMEVNKRVETSKREHKSKLVSEAVSSTKALLDETRELGADVSEAEDLLKQAEDMFGGEDLDAVEGIIKKAEESIISSQSEFKREETSKLVTSTKAKIEEGRELGADVTEAEELLKQAEEMLLTEFDYDTVENLVKKSQTSLASSWDQYHSQRLIDDISRAHGKIVEYREMGVDITEAELILHKAEIEFKQNKFENVDNLLSKISEITEQKFDEHFIDKITVLINDVQSLVREAKERKLDVKVGEELLNNAIAEFENKNYSKAEELTNKAKQIITDIIDTSEVEEVQSLLDRLENLIQDAKILKIDVTPAEQLYRQAEALFKAKEFDKAREYAYKSETILNSLAEKYVKDFNPNLTVELKTHELVVHKWNRFTLLILNDGRISAQEVVVDLKGDLETKGKKKIPVISTDATAELELGLKSSKAGDLPIKIFIHCNRPFDKFEYDFTDTISLRLLDPGKFVVQDVFVIYVDGCLIIHRTREYREMVDDDIFSSMLIAVQNFISDSFGRSPDEGIKRLDFGKNKILIERGPKFFLASVIEGDEPGLLPVYMVETINEIQKNYGEILETWDGYLEKLEGMGEIIDKLLNIKIIEGTTEIEPVSIQEGGGTIDSIKAMIQEAKGQGIDTTEAEAALSQAEVMVDSSGFNVVWDKVKTAEKKVRNARKAHYEEDVNSALDTVKAMIDEARNYGADVTEAEGIFIKMKEMVDREEYPQALEMVETSKVVIQQAKSEKDTSDNFKNMGNNVSIVTEWGLDIPDLKKEKGEINNAIQNKDFQKANSIISNVNKKLKDKVIKKPMEALPFIFGINKNIDDLSGLGINTSESEEKILSAKDAVYNLDFSRANKLLQEVNSNTSTEKRDFYQSKSAENIPKIKHSMTALQKMNINVNEAVTYISEAELKFAEKDFEGAYQAMIKSQKIVDDTSHSYKSKPILKTIISTENIIEQARAHGVDEEQIRPIEKIVHDSRTALEARNYQNAGDLAIRANTTALENFSFIKDAQLELQAQLDTTLSEISTTKEVGADTSMVEDLANKMKSVLEEGDIEATKEYWENIKETLEQLQIPFKAELIRNEIKSIEEYINDSKEKGIDTLEAEHLLENAKTLNEDTGDLDSVQDYLKKAREFLDNANETHRAVVISETIQSTYQLANQIKEMGAEVSYSFELLKQAEAMLRKMDLDSAEEYATNAFNTTEEIKKQFLSREAREKIEKAEKEIAKAQEDSLKTKDAERLLSQAKTYLETGDLDNTIQYAENTCHLIRDVKEQDLEKKAKDGMVEQQKLYLEVKGLGADVSKAEAPLMQAQASIDNKDFEIALTYIDTVKTTLNEVKQPHMVKLANIAIERAKKVMESASNYGADISSAQEIFKEAEEALTAQDFTTAEEKAKEAEKVALWAEKNYYENYVSNEIKTLKENIENLKNQGYNTEVAEELLGKINTMYLGKNFQNIGENIKELHQLLNKIEEERFIQRAKDAISYSKAMIDYIKDNIKDIGPRIKNPEKVIKTAQEEFDNKEYHRAEQLALESQNMVENIKHSKLEQFLFVFRQLQAEEMVTQTKNVISNIRKLGVDLSEAENLIRQAEEAFQDEEKYTEGKEFLTLAKISARGQENKYQEKNAAAAISAAESLIITLKKKKINIETPNKFLNQAKTAFEIKEFKKSILFASKAKMTAKKLQTTSEAKAVTEESVAEAEETEAEETEAEETAGPEQGEVDTSGGEEGEEIIEKDSQLIGAEEPATSEQPQTKAERNEPNIKNPE